MNDLSGRIHASSLAELNKDIALHPNDPDVYIHRGQAYLYEGDSDNALSDFNKALAIDPHSALAYVGKARIHEALSEFDQAIADLHRAYEFGTPKIQFGALWEIAFLHRETRKMPLSLQEYDNLLKSKTIPKSQEPYVRYQRGELLERMGKRVAALADFDKAMSEDPNLVNIHLMRARCFRELGKLQEALKEFTAGISTEHKLYPGDAPFNSHLHELYKERAGVYLQLGKPDLARKDLYTLHQHEQSTMDSIPFRAP